MDVNNSGKGMVIGIDLGDLQRSYQAREKMKTEALAKAEEAGPQKVDPNFNPRRLVNVAQDKGRLLNTVA